jgi:hypothetical protein
MAASLPPSPRNVKGPVRPVSNPLVMGARWWLALAVLAIPAMGDAATPMVLVEDDILLGNPGGAIGGGLSEIIADCDPSAGSQGIDGITFAVPTIARGELATLTTTGAAGIDADVYWYDANCRPDFEASMDRRGTGNETGIIPLDTVVGVVDLIVGANAHVKVTVTV